MDKEKAVEALVYVASKAPGVGRFHAAKILYFAERFHLRAYGRPIVGDRYIAMDHGPVPSFIYDALKGSVAPEDRETVDGALVKIDAYRHPAYKAARDPDISYFSETDLECLDKAIKHCIGRSFGAISDETHNHVAWSNANLNAPMSFDEIMDGVEPEILEEAKIFAAYGVL
ncbi:Panacea domain-containing protein [Rhizobium sp. 11_C7_N12_5]|uniref:Panacea domain-containing protein n=1 Tax=Rhizobium sp. 11_C7_N12_5 TaxID=3240770 RepID=UPI003F259963